MKKFLAMLLISTPALAAVATLSVQGLMSMLIYLVVIGLIFWCIWWALSYFAIPEPFNKIIRVVVGLVALIIVINLLLGLVGHPFISLQ